MQIAFCLFKYFPYGGIQRDLMKLARECLSRDHEVRIYVGRWNASPPAENVEVMVVPTKAATNHTRYEAVRQHVRRERRETWRCGARD